MDHHRRVLSYEAVEHFLNECECLVDASYSRLYSDDIVKCAKMVEVLTGKALDLAKIIDEAPREEESALKP